MIIMIYDGLNTNHHYALLKPGTLNVCDVLKEFECQTLFEQDDINDDGLDGDVE